MNRIFGLNYPAASIAAFAATTLALALAHNQILLIDVVFAYCAATLFTLLVAGRREALVGVALVSAGLAALAVLGLPRIALGGLQDTYRVTAITVFGVALLCVMPHWFRGVRRLRDATAELNDFVDNAPLGISWIDGKGIILRANRAELEMLGYARHEYIGHHVSEFHADARAICELLRRLAQHETLHDFEAQLTAKDGTPRYVSITSNVHWDNGAYAHSRCFTRDVTARVAGARRYKRVESRLQAVVAHAPIILFSYDADGTITLSEGRGLDAFGVPAGSGTGATIAQLTGDNGDARQKFELALAGEAVATTFEYKCLAFETHLTPVLGTDGRVRSVIGVAFDVSAHKQAEQRLQRALDFRNHIMQAASDAIVALDANGRFRLLNRAARDITGYTDAELEGQPFDMLLDPPDALRLRRRFARARIRNAALSGLEVTVTRKDGGRRLVTLSAGWIVEDGSVAGIVATAADVTQRRELEIRHLQEERMASVGRLAAGLAHEYNNLMTAVVGQAELASTSLDDVHPVQQRLDEIREAALRATRMTQRLLVHARQEISEPQVLDANTLLLRLHPLLQRLAGDEVHLEIFPESGLCFVRVDPRLFEQALLDLVADVGAGLPRGGTIIVESTHLESSGAPEPPIVRFVVRAAPNPHGASLEPPPSSFEDLDELCSGVAHSVAECAGGKLSMERRVDGGATATLILPLEPVRHERPSALSSLGVTPSSGAAVSVLVVEDEPAVREFAAQALEAFGYSVVRTANGEEALEVLERPENRIDLVLTDVVMPRMGGVELARAIDDRGLNVAVLFMSGYTGDAQFRRDVAAHEVDFLAKPFSATELAERVRAAVAARHTPRIPDCLRAAAG